MRRSSAGSLGKRSKDGLGLGCRAKPDRYCVPVGISIMASIVGQSNEQR